MQAARPPCGDASLRARHHAIRQQHSGLHGYVDHGARFLKRYLAATHGIVDTHLRFAHDKDISPDVASALARSNDMLARLKVAFAKEHALLLQNDVTDFSADLKTLDTLLKMDGS